MEKEFYDKLFKKLTHLSKTISNCNGLIDEDKEDIVQLTMIELFKKIEEGKINPDFNEIKGYAFITLRNFCIRSKKSKKLDLVEEYEDNIGSTDDSIEELDHLRHLNKIVDILLQTNKYNSLERRIIELIREGMNDREMRSELNIDWRTLSDAKFAVKRKLKSDVERPVKYIIKNKFKDNINYRCQDIHQAVDYLKLNIRQVRYLINEQKINKEGYYILRNKK